MLEIGCGDGARLRSIAPGFKSWTGIDPDPVKVDRANSDGSVAGARFLVGYGEDLGWPEGTFDGVVFTLSLHHIPMEKIPLAIDEATRVSRPDGYILILEPTPEGTFFEAEMEFGCCDGDERKEMAFAYFSMLNSRRLRGIEEYTATVVFQYDSFSDFKRSVCTVAETEPALEHYLLEHALTLHEKQRLNVFSVVDG